MIKAGMQTVSKPHYWEKTVHGLFEFPVAPALLEPAAPSAGDRPSGPGDS
jgi:hypothetical protein